MTSYRSGRAEKFVPLCAVVPMAGEVLAEVKVRMRPRDWSAFNNLLYGILKGEAAKDDTPRCTAHEDCRVDPELAVHCLSWSATPSDTP